MRGLNDTHKTIVIQDALLRAVAEDDLPQKDVRSYLPFGMIIVVIDTGIVQECQKFMLVALKSLD